MQQYDTSNTDDTIIWDIWGIMKNDRERMIQSNAEMRTNILRNNNMVLIKVEEEAESYMLRDMKFSDHDEHFWLQKNLVKYNCNLICRAYAIRHVFKNLYIKS